MKIIAQQSIPKIDDMTANLTVVLRKHENGTYCTHIRNDDTGGYMNGHYDMPLPEAWMDFGERVLNNWPTIDGDYAPETRPLIQPKEIFLYRLTGPTRGVSIPAGTTVTAKTYDEANKALRQIAQSAPGEGAGYDKTGFKVTFEDGRVYEGRFDVTLNDRTRSGMLEGRIREFVQFMAGIYQPAWTKRDPQTEAGYKSQMLEYEKNGTAKEAREFLARYDVGQEAT